VGGRQVMIDSAGQPVAIVETTGFRLARVGDVDLEHARDEGEGFESVAAWRAAHEEMWHSARSRAQLGDPGFTATDDTVVVLERLRVVMRLPAS